MLITLRAQRFKKKGYDSNNYKIYRLKSIRQLHVHARLFQYSVPESNTEYYSHTTL